MGASEWVRSREQRDRWLSQAARGQLPRGGGTVRASRARKGDSGMGQFRDRAGLTRPAGGPVAGPVDEAAAGMFPALWEFLVEPPPKGKGTGQTATLTLFMEDGWCKLCLNDRDSGATGWASGRSVLEAAAALEGQLAGGTLDWRRPRPGCSRRG